MGACRLFNPKSTLATPCPRRGGSPGIFRVVMALKPLFFFLEGGRFCSPSLNQRCGFSITQLNAQLGIITSAQSPRLLIIGV